MKTDNQIIAEFMGLQVYQTSEEMRAVPLEDLREWAYIDQIDYDTSWDWLMPVVEKIESLGYMTVASQNEWNGKQYINIITGVGIIAETVDNPSKFMASDKIKIKAWYKAVVEFIKWYNENKS